MKIIAVLIITLLSHTLFASEFITIGTGGITGNYYPTGGALCKLVNKYKQETKIRCSIESTGGSIDNIIGIKRGIFDFGIVQSDIVYQATNGTAQFKNNPIKKLKSVMSLYPELLALVTRKDANINFLADIKGKRINLGNPGSGNEETAMVLFEESGIKKSDLKFAGALKSSEMPDALRDNKIDGYFYMVGHPAANIKDASSSVNINIVPLMGSNIDHLVKRYPYFSKADIPKDLYIGQNKKTPTFGVKAVLVTSDNISDKTVYNLVKAILENFSDFKKLNPVYENITKESLLKGLSAPLHEGAKKYYKEIGILYK